MIRKLSGKIGETLTGYLWEIAKANSLLRGIIDRVDIIGRSYEYLIRKFAEGSRQLAGEF